MLHSQLAILEAIWGEDRGVHVDEETGTRKFRAMAVADGVAGGTTLGMSAWDAPVRWTDGRREACAYVIGFGPPVWFPC